VTGLEPVGLGLVLLWGTLVGVDLASWPQMMLARPLVAGAVTGLLVGDPAAGLLVGGVLELFALDVLPIGASRYPDFGAGSVGAVAVAAGAPLGGRLGLAVAVGLVAALAARHATEWVRRANADAARRAETALAAGDPAAVGRLQRSGLARDAARAAGVTGLAMGLALGVRSAPPLDPALAQALALIAVAGGVAAAIHGAIRTASQGGRLAWVAAGLAAGGLLLVWR